MNQILSTGNNYNNNYDKKDTKKIIIIFCIAVLLVSIVIIAVTTMRFSKKGKSGNNVVPSINIIRENDEAKEITIKAECTDGINYIIYTWNNEKETKVNLNGSANFERIIDIPEKETNNLKVEVVSIKGMSNEKTEEYKLDVDSSRPQIDSIAIVDSKLQITASDDNGIDYLKYQWENEREITVNADENDNKTINVEIDIKRGTYKLMITVVDISGNKEQMSKLITGVNEPEISVTKQGGVIHTNITHDMGFKRIEILINNDLYVYDENYAKYDKNETTVKLDFPLQEGHNLVQIKAYSLEKLSDDDSEELENYSFKTYAGECTYEPVQ